MQTAISASIMLCNDALNNNLQEYSPDGTESLESHAAPLLALSGKAAAIILLVFLM